MFCYANIPIERYRLEGTSNRPLLNTWYNFLITSSYDRKVAKFIYFCINLVLSIRNTVAHPENMEPLTAYYHLPHDKTNQKYIKYKKWDESLEEAAHALGFSLGEEICRVHQKEKEELEKVIFENSTSITMNSPEWKNDILSADVKAGIKRTRERIETQSTAAGIMDFFKDAQFLGKGKNIKEELGDIKDCNRLLPNSVQDVLKTIFTYINYRIIIYSYV